MVGDGLFGWFGHAFMTIVTGLFTLLGLLVFIAVVALLVRFLLVATKAAKIYVAKNTPELPPAPASPAAAAATDAAATTPPPAAAKPATVTTSTPTTRPAASKPTTSKPATRPAPTTKPRTPKKPPTT